MALLFPQPYCSCGRSHWCGAEAQPLRRDVQVRHHQVERAIRPARDVRIAYSLLLGHSVPSKTGWPSLRSVKV